MFYYVYVLVSLKDKKFYVGLTENIKIRFNNHVVGKVRSTKNRRPLKLIGYEVYIMKKDAGRREKYLKSSDGRKEIRIRYKGYLKRMINEKS